MVIGLDRTRCCSWERLRGICRGVSVLGLVGSSACRGAAGSAALASSEHSVDTDRAARHRQRRLSTVYPGWGSGGAFGGSHTRSLLCVLERPGRALSDLFLCSPWAQAIASASISNWKVGSGSCRVHPLLPLGALMHERVPAPNPSAEIEQMRRRDPRLREPTDQQQLVQMPGVRPVRLRSLLLALQTGGLSRLGQMPRSAYVPHLLHEKPPAGRCLQRDLERCAIQPLKPPRHRDPVRRRDSRMSDLAGERVDPLRRDLRPVLIHPHHDRHQTPHPLASPAVINAPLKSQARRASHTVEHGRYLRSIGRPRGRNPRAPMTPFDAEDRPPSPPHHADWHINIFRRPGQPGVRRQLWRERSSVPARRTGRRAAVDHRVGDLGAASMRRSLNVSLASERCRRAHLRRRLRRYTTPQPRSRPRTFQRLCSAARRWLEMIAPWPSAGHARVSSKNTLRSV